MSTLYIRILSPRLMHAASEGREFLNLWIKLLPDHLPEKIGTHEPVRQAFDPNNVGRIETLWSSKVLFCGRHPRLRGEFVLGGGVGRDHSEFLLELAANTISQPDAVRFFQEACKLLCADFAMMEILPLEYREFGEAAGTVCWMSKNAKQLRFFLNNLILRQNVPDFFWATVFGKPYVELFDIKKVTTAPTCQTRELCNNVFYLQLTPNIHDSETAWDTVCAQRRRVKTHLDSDVFFDPLNPQKKYRVPTFEIGDALPPFGAVGSRGRKMFDAFVKSNENPKKQPE